MGHSYGSAMELFTLFRYPARAYSIIQWKLVAGQGQLGLSCRGSVGTGPFAIAISRCVPFLSKNFPALSRVPT